MEFLYQLLCQAISEVREEFELIANEDIAGLQEFIQENENLDPSSILHIKTDNLELLKMVLNGLDDFTSVPNFSYNIVKYKLVKTMKYLQELNIELDMTPFITDAKLDFFKIFLEGVDVGSVSNILDLSESIGNKRITNYLRNLGYKTGKEVDKVEFLSRNPNPIDMITAEKIKKNSLIVFKEGTTEYYFNRLTLYKNFKCSGRWCNPFTNSLLPGIIRRQISDYLDRISIEIDFIQVFSKNFTCKVPIIETLWELLVIFTKVIQSVKSLLLTELILVIDGTEVSIYDFDLETPIKDLYEVEFSKIFITVIPQAERAKFEARVFPILLKMSKKHEFLTLKELIPDIYEGRIPKVVLPPRRDYRILKQITDISKFIEKLKKSYLLSRDARKLQKLIEGKFCPEIVNNVTHLIFSRVVDKWKLGDHPIEYLYIRNKYQLPDWDIHAL